MPPASLINCAEDRYVELLKEVIIGGIFEESAWSRVATELENEQSSRPARWRHRLHVSAAKWLSRRGFHLLRARAFDRNERENGRDWPLVGFSMIGRRRLDQVHAAVETVLAEGVPGDFLEAGVWRGGTCMLMKALLRAHEVKDRTVWLADSFEGLPPPADASDGTDLSENDYLKVTAPTVRRNFERLGLWDDQVRLLEGWFCDTLPAAPIEALAVLRLDGDLYSSTMDVLTSLYERVSPGGFVIVDDYESWPGCRRAVHEFLDQVGEKPEMQRIDGDAVYWRRAGATSA